MLRVRGPIQYSANLQPSPWHKSGVQQGVIILSFHDGFSKWTRENSLFDILEFMLPSVQKKFITSLLDLIKSKIRYMTLGFNLVPKIILTFIQSCNC